MSRNKQTISHCLILILSLMILASCENNIDFNDPKELSRLNSIAGLDFFDKVTWIVLTEEGYKDYSLRGTFYISDE
jgi:hypothetical protein